MSKLNKTSFRFYTAWDYDKEEKWLNKESEQGWQLTKGGCFHSKFIKNENIRYIYKLDYNGSFIRNSQEKQRYIDFFEEQGFEFINNTFNGWIYFRKEYKECNAEEEYEIYTDKTSLTEMLNRWILIAKTMITILGVMSFFYIGLSVFNKEYILFVDVILFVSMILFLNNGIKKMKAKLS